MQCSTKINNNNLGADKDKLQDISYNCRQVSGRSNVVASMQNTPRLPTISPQPRGNHRLPSAGVCQIDILVTCALILCT